MKQFPLLAIGMAVALLVCSCDDKKKIDDPDVIGGNDGPKKVLSIDEQKEYFSNSVTEILDYFHPADQEHAVEVAEHFARMFEEEDWYLEEIEDFYYNQYRVLWEEARYITKMVNNQALASSNPIYTFSFANDARHFEGSTTTHSIDDKGVSKDGKYKLILHDGNKTYTAMAWPEGKVTTYEVDYADFGWEEGHRIVRAELPEKIHFVFKEDDTELISATVELDIVKDDHIITKVNATVTSLSYQMSEKFNATAVEVSYSVKNNKDVLLAMQFEIPSLPALIKKGDLSYEEWFRRYEKQWENIVLEAGDAFFSLNIGDRVQFKGKGTEGGKLYQDLMDFFKSEEEMSERKMWKQLADIINEHAEVTMYFNSKVAQGKVKVGVVHKEDYYLPLPLLYFEDGSSYDLSSYFMEDKVIDNYLDQVDRLLASYERLFNYFDVNFKIYY